MTYVKLFFIAFPIMIAADLLWITVIASSFYKSEMEHLLSPNLNFWAAIAFYIIYVAALVLLVLHPAIMQHSLGKAIVSAAVLGLTAYATYDLTNLATFRDWPLLLTCVDMAWGAFLSAFVSGATYLLATKVFGV